MSLIHSSAPAFKINKWLNLEESLSLSSLKGKVVVVFAFQMLCPGCVEHSIPQARRVHSLFSHEDVQVIGLHTVFEHHNAMEENSLKAFLHEYPVEFPVGIDRPPRNQSDPIPQTMRIYAMKGTPTLLLIDRQGKLRKQTFGREPDLALGAEIMSLINECRDASLAQVDSTNETPPDKCTGEQCVI